MKRFGCYIILMIIIVVLLPLIIVRSCATVEEPKPSENESNITINVYIADQKKVVKMQLEEYLLGVVAAEMPASFEIEALKAQAIAARTYALGREVKIYGSGAADILHSGADVCTDPAHCQAWISKDTAMKRWGLLYSFKNWNKICKAVNATSGQVIKYNNVLINPLFHANSGGHTENSEDVWEGTAEPYLRGVESFGEDTFSQYENQVILEQKDMIKVLKEFNPKLELKEKDILSNIKIQEYSSGDRILEMKIGNITMKGTEFRELFQLKSANFKLAQLPNEKISITTLGYGHGVGMSQCGANYLAKKGTSCIDILKYYYKGVEITKD
ncbi:MAG TPA: stage II sporulation protein D [Ruminiclostridium sp.]